MARKARGVKAMIMRMGPGARKAARDARELPPFRSPRAPQHSRIAGRGSHKAKP